MRLKGFDEPDTSSQLEGYLQPGKYDVIEYRQGYPTQDTDFALVFAPSLGAGDTWLCTRWRQHVYADVVEVPARQPGERDFSDAELPIREAALTDLLPQFHRFRYDLDEARYPFELPGVRVPLAPPLTNNCCTFAEALLVKAWQDVHGESFSWSPERHRQMMIISSDDFFSPVTAAVESRMAQPVADADEPPHPWTIVQGWRHQWREGHTFIIVDHHVHTDRVLTLESNSGYGLDGVGCRKLGNLRDLDGGRPPAQWWENDELWTWSKVRGTYRFLGRAVLTVTDRHWSR
jgi:hypothetical protein